MEEKPMEIAEVTVRYYFVDYDSVGQKGLYGIENLSEKDKVAIFYKENKNSIELSFFEKIYSSKAEIKFQKTEASFNCLFSSYLGYIIGMNSDAEYYIVSHDKEFENLKKFWAEKEIAINIYSDISGNIKKSQVAPSSNTETFKHNLESAIEPLNLSTEERKQLCRLFYNTAYIDNPSDRLTELQNSIKRSFSKENAIKYYQALKPLISNG